MINHLEDMKCRTVYRDLLQDSNLCCSSEIFYFCRCLLMTSILKCLRKPARHMDGHYLDIYVILCLFLHLHPKNIIEHILFSNTAQLSTSQYSNMLTFLDHCIFFCFLDLFCVTCTVFDALSKSSELDSLL